MTQNLLLYWHRLTHVRLTHLRAHEPGEAPVLELAACFGNPVIAAQQSRERVALLSDAAQWRAEAR